MNGRDFIDEMQDFVVRHNTEGPCLDGMVDIPMDYIRRLTLMARALSLLNFDAFNTSDLLLAGSGPIAERIDQAVHLLEGDYDSVPALFTAEIETESNMATSMSRLLATGVEEFGPKWAEEVLHQLSRRLRRKMVIRIEWR